MSMGDQRHIRSDDAREAQLAERGRRLVAGAIADVRAPEALRARVEGQRRDAAPARRRRRLVLGGALAGATALALAIVLLVAPGGTPGAPTVVEAARLGALPAQAPPPPRARGAPRELAVREGGIAFPAWQEFGWAPTGVRRDRVHGRNVTTVLYRTRSGAPVSYSVVAGRALLPLGEAQPRGPYGVAVVTRRLGDRWVVAWERNGHTCIITASLAVPLDRIAALTSW
jgi:hypothetical protein